MRGPQEAAQRMWGAGEETGVGCQPGGPETPPSHPARGFATNLSDLLAPIVKVVLSLTEKALKRKTGKQTAA